MLDACRLVDLKEWQSDRPPVMQLHAGAAEASQLPDSSSTAEFVRLHTLLRCAQKSGFQLQHVVAELRTSPVIVVQLLATRFAGLGEQTNQWTAQ